jgi:hypothetical protein
MEGMLRQHMLLFAIYIEADKQVEKWLDPHVEKWHDRTNEKYPNKYM